MSQVENKIDSKIASLKVSSCQETFRLNSEKGTGIFHKVLHTISEGSFE